MNAIWRIFEWPWLVLLNIGNHFWNLGLWLQEIQHYYRNALLWRVDLRWMLEYAWVDPFGLSQRSRQQCGLPEDLTVYGETPWTTLQRICDALELSSEDCFIDLGAGTGRTLLFVQSWYGCRCLGYELVPRFVEKFTWLKQHMPQPERLQMKEKDWLQVDSAELTQGQVFLLVGSCYSDVHVVQAQQQLSQLKPGSRIATVSYPLQGEAFELTAEFRAPFSWGWGTVYVHRVS